VTRQTSLKQDLFAVCMQMLQDQILLLKTELEQLKESMEFETKSTMGDKYETSRALLQQEEAQCLEKLQFALGKQQTLQKIDVNAKQHKATFGSIIQTSNGCYFISIGLGKIQLIDAEYFCISAVSPIGAKLIGLTTGDRFEFNGNTIEILDVF